MAPIIGTGFIVDSDGLIATNAHVVNAIRSIKRPPGLPGHLPLCHVLFFKSLREEGVGMLNMSIAGIALIDQFDASGVYYGPKQGPDIAFVKVKFKGLPALAINTSLQIEEGMSVATAGYPMGNAPLTAPGWVHQITPTLQEGIVSAVQPFSCRSPHGYAVNVMIQGGASGSPLFLPDTGEVVGVMYASLVDVEALKLKTANAEQVVPYRIPTNISYAVPSHYITALRTSPGSDQILGPEPDAVHLDDVVAKWQRVDATKDATHGFRTFDSLDPGPE
jgi:S1-C subfamily serine protease